MEDRTLLEELLERSPDDRMHKKKMDRAYQLLSLGELGEAGALFDEILAEEPFNQDALTGKRLIERSRALDKRMENAAKRARTALPEALSPHAAEEKPAAQKTEESEPRPSLLRSRKVKTALIAVFALLVAAAAAFIVTDGFGAADTGAELQQQAVFLEAH